MPVGGQYLYRSLQQRLTEVLMRKLPDKMFEDGTLIPTSADLQPGARTLIQDQVLAYGEAKILAGEADDIPLMEISATENEYRIVTAVASFSVSFQEEEAQKQAGRYGVQYNPRQIKMDTARTVIAEKLNKVAAYGDSQLGFTGFVNNASVTLTDSSFDPYASTTTANDLADFVLEELESIATDTNNVETATDLVCSTAFAYLLKRRTMPYSAMPVLDFIQETMNDRRKNVGIKQITPVRELKSENLEANGVQATSTNKDRFILYPLDPSNVERHIMVTKLFPPDYLQVRGMRKLMPMYACASETIINYPAAFRYVDSAKKS